MSESISGLARKIIDLGDPSVTAPNLEVVNRNRRVSHLAYELATRVLAPSPSVTELIDRGTELLLASHYYEDFEGDAKAVVTTIVTGLTLAQGQR